ncbi:MAG: YbaB/EbfC family nucleoid-associated protein [Acidobacteria bacterium]|nr:YbaB/EbfC family nucleoid-associated protein [Acidobacteriota bacterium]
MKPGNINQMLKKAQKAQEQIQAEIAAMRVDATAGGGAVRAVVDGQKNLLELTIAAEALEEPDPAMISDLVLAAVSEAQRKAEDEAGRKLGALAGMFGLPPGLGF